MWWLHQACNMGGLRYALLPALMLGNTKEKAKNDPTWMQDAPGEHSCTRSLCNNQQAAQTWHASNYGLFQ